jgi:hypothetical protein
MRVASSGGIAPRAMRALRVSPSQYAIAMYGTDDSLSPVS